MTQKLLASLLLFVFLTSPLEAAFASEPEPETSGGTVHLMLVHILVDEYGGILGIAPVTDNLFLWAYAPFALSDSEISSLYTSPDTFQNGTDLEGYWKFDGGYTDDSGNGNTLTGQNSPVFSSDVAFSSGGTITTSTTTYTYATTSTSYANPHAAIQITPPTFSATTTLVYDNNGNLTQSGTVSGTTTFSWDYRNRMTGSATSTASGTTTNLYDHFDQRVRKSNNSAATTYIEKFYDTTASTATSSASTTAYIWVGDTVVATVEGNGYATSTRFVHSDHLGSTNVVTDSGGNVTQAIDYYPFGTRRINSGSDVSGREFIGQFYDEASALSYLNARYYEGSRGQFLSQDPAFWQVGNAQAGIALLRDPQLLNSYGYSRNNPIVLKDADGKIPTVVAGALIGAGIGLATQFAGDLLSGDWGGWQAYAGAAAGGAVQGAFWGSGAGVAAFLGSSILSGTVQGGVREGLDYATDNGVQLGSVGADIGTSIFSNLVGGVFLKTVGVPRIAGITSGRNSYDAIAKQIFAKLNNGIISNVSVSTQVKMGVSYSINNVYSSGSQAITQAVQSYNASVGAIVPQDKLWVTPSGAVITWSGSIVIGPTAQSTPETAKK